MFQHKVFFGTPALYCWSLLLSGVILSSIDDRWTVNAAPRSSPRSTLLTNLHRRVNPDNIPGPDVSDYPSDEVIYITCGQLEINQCVMFTEIGDSLPAKYFALLNQKKVYTDLFPEDPEPFTKMLGRSLKWYQDFADRYSRIYSERCSGEVFLVSNWPRGPVSTCSVWYRIEFPVLKMNPLVTKVILVDKLNYGNQVEIWPEDRRRPEDRGDDGGDDPGGGGQPRNPLEPGPNRPRLPGVTPVGGARALGLFLGGGILPAVGTLLIPPTGSVPSLPAPAPSDTPPYNPGGENLQDVVFGDSASLPGQDWNTFTGDGSLDVSILSQGGGGSTDSTDDLFASDLKQPSLWSDKDDSADLFVAADTNLFSINDNPLTRRRFAILEERDRETCFDWAGDGDDPALAHVGTSDYPTPSQGGRPNWALVQVVQYQRPGVTDPYVFDLVLYDGGVDEIANEEGLSASPGEWVGISFPGSGQVYVKAGQNDEDPLQFRFGLSEWDSTDLQTHDCHLDAWKGGIRTGDCRFNY